MTDLIYLHLMGEPLTHPQLKEFLAVAEHLNAPIGITTNGTLIHRHVDTLKSPAIRQFNVSFHAFTDPEKTKIAAEAVKQIAQNSPDMYVNLRLWMSGTDFNLSRDFVAMTLMEVFDFNRDVIDDHLLGKRSSRNIGGNVYVHFDRPFDWPGTASPDLCGTCHGLSAQIGILTDGTVVPCCLDNEGNIPLGNIDSTPIESILGSTKAKSIRGGFTRGEMVEELCQKCGYAQDRFGQKKQVMHRRKLLTNTK